MNIKNDNRGSTYIITVLAMTAILGFAALVIDVGLVFIERAKLSNAADASVLAGSQELPTNPAKAVKIAEQYLVKNGISLQNANISVLQNNSAMQVAIKNDVSFVFAKVLGILGTEVSASSTAVIGPISAVYDGIRPLVIQQQQLQYAQQIVLKENAGDGYSGNYGAVALGGNGADVFENNIKYGYSGKLKIGDTIYTETGNMAGPVYKGIQYITDNDYSTYYSFSKDSSRLWTIPIVDTLEVSGGKPVKVVGFAQIFVENAYKQSGKTEITGRFIQFVTNGDIDMDQADYGLKGVKLIQ